MCTVAFDCSGTKFDSIIVNASDYYYYEAVRKLKKRFGEPQVMVK